MRVLLVEDEPRLSATLSRGLKAEGFVVVSVGTGVEGLHEAIESSFDVVVPAKPRQSDDLGAINPPTRSDAGRQARRNPTEPENASWSSAA